MKMIKDESGRYTTPPVHTMFGLTYAEYFAVPRLILQSMPLEWQNQFVKLVEELDKLAPHMPDSFVVLRDDTEYIKRVGSDTIRILKPDEFANYKYPDYELHAKESDPERVQESPNV